MTADHNHAPHVVALDGVRGVALLAVLVFHFIGHGPGAAAWPAWVRTPALFGWAGVDLFFVLSGFLITRILLASRGRPRALRVFYARRVLRIFPLYYALLCVLTLVLFVHRRGHLTDAEKAGLPALWLYYTNFLVAARGFGAAIFQSVQFTHLWTLAIEEQFYLLWPLAMLLLPRRWLLPLCGAVIVTAPLTRALRYDGGPTAVYVLTWCRADALAWGSAFAVAQFLWPVASVRRVAAVVGLIGLAVTGGVLLAAGSVDEYGKLVQLVGYSAIAAGCAGGVAWVTHRPSVARPFLAFPALTAIGRYSYGAYLFHIPLRGLASAVWRSGLHRDPAALSLTQAAATALLLTLVTLGLAAGSYHGFERFFLKLKPRLERPGI